MRKKIIAFVLSVAFMLMPLQAFAGTKAVVLLNAVTTTGASDAYGVYQYENKTFYVTAASVVTGGTVLIQTSYDATNWATIATVSVTANGTTEVSVSGLTQPYIRANLSSRTDGTYTVSVMFQG